MALGLSHWYQDYFIRSWIIIFERVDRSSWSTFFDVPGTTWSTAIVTGRGAPERSRPRPTTPSAPLASPSTRASAEFVCSMVTSRTLLKRSNFLLKQKTFFGGGGESWQTRMKSRHFLTSFYFWTKLTKHLMSNLNIILPFIHYVWEFEKLNLTNPSIQINYDHFSSPCSFNSF